MSKIHDRPAVLVTGGAGYIGSHTCKALDAAGYVPVTYDNLVYGHRWAVRWGPLVEGDLTNRALLEDVMAEHQVSAVVHLAAYAYVGESILSPGKYFANNVSNSINVLEAMRVRKIEPIVFSSTCATYGMPEVLPIDEYHRQRPVNPYGESKLFVEKMLRWYGVAHGMRSVALRYFNAAGADPECEVGEDHDPETHLIPLIIETALGRRQAIHIFGTDYPTPDGTAVRDYVHVTDLAEAHVKALKHLIGGGASLELNLGTGTGYSVRQVIAAAERHAGRPIASSVCPRRAGDPAELVADAARARHILDWEPRLSTLEQIIETAWRWHEKKDEISLQASAVAGS